MRATACRYVAVPFVVGVGGKTERPRTASLWLGTRWLLSSTDTDTRWLVAFSLSGRFGFVGPSARSRQDRSVGDDGFGARPPEAALAVGS